MPHSRSRRLERSVLRPTPHATTPPPPLPPPPTPTQSAPSSSSLDPYDDDQGELTAYYVRPALSSPSSSARQRRTPLGSSRKVQDAHVAYAGRTGGSRSSGSSSSADTSRADYYNGAVQPSDASFTVLHTSPTRQHNVRNDAGNNGGGSKTMMGAAVHVPHHTTTRASVHHESLHAKPAIQLVSSTPALGRRGVLVGSSSSSTTTTANVAQQVPPPPPPALTAQLQPQQDIVDVLSSGVSTVSDVPHPDALSSSSSHSATKMTWMTVPPPLPYERSHDHTASSFTPQHQHRRRGRGDVRQASAIDTTTTSSSSSLSGRSATTRHQQQPHSAVHSHRVSYGVAARAASARPENNNLNNSSGGGGSHVNNNSTTAAATVPSRIVTVLPLEPSRIGPAPHSLVPRELHVAQSVVTDDNPFRVQSFEEFCRNPVYDPPRGLARYAHAALDALYQGQTATAMTTSNNHTNLTSDGVALSPGDQLLQRLLADKPRSPQERSAMLRAVQELARGTWLYKWTRTNLVHRRYVWLDLEQGVLRWAGQPPSRFMAFSSVRGNALRLADVTALSADALRAGKSERIVYRMALHTMSRRIYLASELREKFDLWYAMLQRLTRPSRQGGIPGIWSRPHAQACNTGGNGAVGRWASRYSPLQAVAEGSYTGWSVPPQLLTQTRSSAAAAARCRAIAY